MRILVLSGSYKMVKPTGKIVHQSAVEKEQDE